MSERDFAIEVVRRLRESGYEALFAGGCVRDELLGLTPADYDVATSARPEDVIKRFRHTVEVGVSFGVVEVIGARQRDGSFHKVQVATFRSDGNYSDGRRPDSVIFSSAEEDAKRRDFTINGMFFDPMAERVIDYVGGQEDLQKRVLRAIGDPRDRFREDKLRLLRAVRLASRFDFAIDEPTALAIRDMAGEINVVSPERIAEELRKILVHPHRYRAMEQMEELGLLRHIVPEGPLAFAVLERLLLASFPLAFAALVLEVGKPVAGRMCRRLKLSNVETARIEWLIHQRHALVDAASQRPSRLYPILIHPGIDELLVLHRAQGIDVAPCDQILRDTPHEILNPAPLLTGDDLLALGWPQGPRFKTVLDAIRVAQLDGEIRTKEEAIAKAVK